MTSRQILRQKLIEQRKSLDSSFREKTAKYIATYFGASPRFKKSQHIAFYNAVNGEADPSALLQLALDLKKICYLPVLDTAGKNTLHFVAYEKNTKLKPNRFGILEPVLQNKKFKPEKLDLVFVPLVAFDVRGNRLGMGAGYYDRTFAFLLQHKTGPQLVGLAYEFQKLSENLTPESWDISLDYAVTEKQIYRF